jgi:hypothetical protein
MSIPAARSETPPLSRATIITTLQTAGVPDSISVAVADQRPVDQSELAALTDAQRASVNSVQVQQASQIAVPLASTIMDGWGLCTLIPFFASGLLGWLLVMKKQGLKCSTCGAVSPHEPKPRNFPLPARRYERIKPNRTNNSASVHASEFEDSSLQAIVFVMSSGTEIAVTRITLWPADLLQQAAELFARSGSLSQGFTTGIGFIGSLGHVVADALMLGAAEAVVGAAMQAKAGTLQEQAANLIQRAAKEASLVPVSHIYSVQDGDPATWCARYRFSNGNVRAFVYGGERALQVQTVEGATRQLVWSAVEQTYSIRR